jgi:hypothetical protein
MEEKFMHKRCYWIYLSIPTNWATINIRPLVHGCSARATTATIQHVIARVQCKWELEKRCEGEASISSGSISLAIGFNRLPLWRGIFLQKLLMGELNTMNNGTVNLGKK